MTLEEQIQRAQEASVRLEHFLIGKQHTTKTNRDAVSLHYWSIIFEHHQGILLLLRTKHFAPAFALMRPIIECFLRLYLVMHGTDAQFASILNGTYCTEFANIGAKIDDAWGLEPLFGPWLNKDRMSILHGFTHGGVEQLSRRSIGNDIVPNFSDEEVRAVMEFSTLFPFLTTLAVLDFLGYQEELQMAGEMYAEYLAASA